MAISKHVNLKSGWRGLRARSGKNPSRTPGKNKSPDCQTDPIKKFFACHPHAIYHRQYPDWHAKFRIIGNR